VADNSLVVSPCQPLGYLDSNIQCFVDFQGFAIDSPLQRFPLQPFRADEHNGVFGLIDIVGT
jgi:hypothetical protein